MLRNNDNVKVRVVARRKVVHLDVDCTPYTLQLFTYHVYG